MKNTIYNINDYVIYKNYVCKVEDIITNNESNNKCYILIPINYNDIKISFPIMDEFSYLLSKKEE